MKNALYLVGLILAAAAGFYAGRQSQAPADGANESARVALVPSVPPPLSTKANTGTGVDATPTPEAELSDIEKARALTPEERLVLLEKGSLIFDSLTQAEYLGDLIKALTKEEMERATQILGGSQNQGNFHAQVVWDTLWKHWGKVDAAGALAHFAEFPGGKSRADARHVMQGWLEADPAAALAWAQHPRTGTVEIAAAAMAITHSAGGDAHKLESLLLAMPEGAGVKRECLQDYFDLAGMAQGKASPSAIYAQMPEALRKEAWAVTMQRLTYTEPQEAVNWLAAHAKDPGFDYRSTERLVSQLARDDPAATAQWAAHFPVGEPTAVNNAAIHPAAIACRIWLDTEPEAAKAWILAQPPETPWLDTLRVRLGNDDGIQ